MRAKNHSVKRTYKTRKTVKKYPKKTVRKTVKTKRNKNLDRKINQVFKEVAKQKQKEKSSTRFEKFKKAGGEWAESGKNLATKALNSKAAKRTGRAGANIAENIAAAVATNLTEKALSSVTQDKNLQNLSRLNRQGRRLNRQGQSLRKTASRFIEESDDEDTETEDEDSDYDYTDSEEDSDYELSYY